MNAISVPVLTYHSLNVLKNAYDQNDHIAFGVDLRTINSLGLRVVPLARVVDWHAGVIPDGEMQDAVAISLDDGSWLDFHDVEHPTCGPQVSMYNLLRQFQDEVGSAQQPDLHVTSFVIASPQARTELDAKDLLGYGWWGDDWWTASSQSGLMSIESHSWDHNHETLDRVAQRDQLKGDFTNIDTFGDCEIQVARSAEYIAWRSGVRPTLFAYPWGKASDYLLHDYMPNYAQNHGLRAAFSTCPRQVTRDENKWYLPRYVCGHDWKTPAALRKILRP
jgi:hypothetical protein